jgi:hypothetical protein
MRPVRLLVALIVALFASPALAAGDVTGVVSGRTLTLTGDSSSNRVQITTGGATNAIKVTPLDGTTLNGSASPQTFQRVRNVAVLMGAGDDRVDFTSVNVAGNVRVRLEDGADAVYFTAATIRGRATVRAGAGTDLVRTESSSVFHGPVNFRGESDNDEMQITGAQFRERLHVEGNDDDDHVLLSGLTCGTNSRAEIFAGRGVDNCEVLFCQFADDAHFNTGHGDDRLRLAGSRYGVDIEAFGGNGIGDVLAIEGGNVFVRLQDYGGFEEGQPVQ